MVSKHHTSARALRWTRNGLLGGAAMLAALPFTGTAFAQPAAAGASESTSIDELVVTARRRDERLQDVPAAITALGAQELQRYSITNVADAAKMVPQLLIGR